MSTIRAFSPEPARYRDGHLELDFEGETVLLDSRPLVLTRKELRLLAVLVENAGEVVTRTALLSDIWGYSREVRTRTLDVHIRRLREKLAPFGGVYIETIFGVGYRFQPFRWTQPGLASAPRRAEVYFTRSSRLAN
ncbi:MAG: winged helix-turn-helix domain-containing protein [Bryobacteraceae bacterium]